MAMDRRLTIGPAGLVAELMVPAAAVGLVVFAHGSGSGRLSPRNRRVASRLREHGIGTLLVDLLRPTEGNSPAHVFDITLLAGRLGDCLDQLRAEPALRTLPLGLFGASTGAAAALDCAAMRGRQVRAVVCRSGRPDLASALPGVQAPTLLIAGSADPEVLRLNLAARPLVGGECRVAVVPRASHLFIEAGTLDRCADLAIDWFQGAFRAPAQSSGAGMPPPRPAEAAGEGSRAIMQSVVRTRAAIEAAFCSAKRVTLAGSITPICSRSPYSRVAAL